MDSGNATVFLSFFRKIKKSEEKAEGKGKRQKGKGKR
jgi:hypothetical protein